MNTINPPALSHQQISDYRENGYLILRQVLSLRETVELRRLVQQQVKCNAYPPTLSYPQPAKYTISGNQMAVPGLAPIAEHPTVVDAVECLLGQPAHLTAYVAYLRTPGDRGSGAHCDYKRWRPVGSSMNWLFAIIPLTDFNPEYGPFLVSPGSHKLSRVIDEHTHVRDLTRPDATQLTDFIDPELKAGDLLLANEHTWHKAPAGTTTEDRCGIFNKYCAVNAPPATGYYAYNSAARDALSDTGKRLIPVCFDQPIKTTRLLIESPDGQGSKFLLQRNDEKGSWQLPGGKGWEEETGVGWDVGSRVGSLQALTEKQLGVQIPWVSYIEDVEAEDGICRVYGFSDETLTEESVTNSDCEWFTANQLRRLLGDDDEICRAIATWQRDDRVRGKGKACHQSKHQFD